MAKKSVGFVTFLMAAALWFMPVSASANGKEEPCDTDTGSVSSVPELDASTGAAALALLLGGALVLSDRRRRPA